ncbi:MAG: FG-GAP repeat domain-containing protein [Planctomycetota bacterium]
MKWTALSTLLLMSPIASLASAQQFQEVPNLLPVPELWTEHVLPIDANEDGKWDVFLVYANGWTVPGDLQANSTLPLPPTLLINTGNNGAGDPVFVNQTAALLPANFRMHGKFSAGGDVNGDGHADIAIAVAFPGRQRLLIKKPATGLFAEEAFRLPPNFLLNSFSVGEADLDNDGDLDLVFTDAGLATFAAPGGLTRLLINDGLGFFTAQPTWMNSALKIGAQNAKIVGPEITGTVPVISYQTILDVTLGYASGGLPRAIKTVLASLGLFLN